MLIIHETTTSSYVRSATLEHNLLFTTCHMKLGTKQKFAYYRVRSQDQYNLKTNDFRSEIKLPSIEFGDFFFLLFSSSISYYIRKQMKGYKALEA